MKFLFVLLLLLTVNEGICQKGDYLITNTGDTIRGKINLESKVFHIAGNSPLKINAEEVSRVRSENYKGHAVFSGKLLTYTDNLYDLELGYFKKTVIDTVLILDEIYTSSKINLYYGISDYKTPFYFYKTPLDAGPVQLVVHYYLDGGLTNYINDPLKYPYNKARIVIEEDKSYVNQLYAIMGGCKNIPKTTWEALAYRSYSLKQVAKRYNKCD